MKNKEEVLKEFEETGEDSFGSRGIKIDWWGMLRKAGILILIILILVVILK